MKKLRLVSLLTILTLCLVAPLNVLALYPLNTVTIKVFQDQSYLNMYSNQPSYINSTMTNVNYPFKNKWNIQISPSYYNTTGMPLESCSLGYFTVCTYSNCGNTCQNSYTTPNHHKNFDYNCYFAQATYGYSGWDLALAVSSATLCHIHGSGHDTCGLGMVPSVGSDFAMTKLTTGRGNPGNVRVIQHELTHTFGCSDGGCTSEIGRAHV